MQAVSIILFLIFLYTLGLYTFGMIRPKHKTFTKFGDNITRKKLSIGFIPMLLILFVAFGITAPSQAQTNNAAQQSLAQTAQQQKDIDAAKLKAIEDSTPQTKDVIETASIPFDNQNKNDPTLPQGITKVIQIGVNGSKQIIYSVTTVNGKETGRTEKTEVIIQPAVTQITAVGTYGAPTSVQPASNGSSGYVNVDGNYVSSPSSNPSGATAQCRDGTYSYSQHRSGTCSYHGGVAVWL